MIRSSSTATQSKSKNSLMDSKVCAHSLSVPRSQVGKGLNDGAGDEEDEEGEMEIDEVMIDDMDPRDVPGLSVLSQLVSASLTRCQIWFTGTLHQVHGSRSGSCCASTRRQRSLGVGPGIYRPAATPSQRRGATTIETTRYVEEDPPLTRADADPATEALFGTHPVHTGHGGLVPHPSMIEPPSLAESLARAWGPNLRDVLAGLHGTNNAQAGQFIESLLTRGLPERHTVTGLPERPWQPIIQVQEADGRRSTRLGPRQAGFPGGSAEFARANPGEVSAGNVPAGDVSAEYVPRPSWHRWRDEMTIIPGLTSDQAPRLAIHIINRLLPEARLRAAEDAARMQKLEEDKMLDARQAEGEQPTGAIALSGVEASPPTAIDGASSGGVEEMGESRHTIVHDSLLCTTTNTVYPQPTVSYRHPTLQLGRELRPKLFFRCRYSGRRSQQPCYQQPHQKQPCQNQPYQNQARSRRGRSFPFMDEMWISQIAASTLISCKHFPAKCEQMSLTSTCGSKTVCAARLR